MRFLLILICLVASGCADTPLRDEVRFTSEDVVGDFRAPLMITWSHGFEFRADGTVRYEITYDTFIPTEDDSFVTGHYYEGTWVLKSPTLIEVRFVASDGNASLFHLRPEKTISGIGFRQVDPKADDGSEFIFTKAVEQ